MSDYKQLFKDTFGDLQNQLLEELVSSSFPTRKLPYWSPVRKAAEELIATAGKVVYLWETEDGDPYPNPGIAWALDGGMLPLALEQLDEIVAALDRTAEESSVFEGWPKATILQEIHLEASVLLELLSKTSGNSVLGSGERLFTLALDREPWMTSVEQEELLAAREVLSQLWLEGITAARVAQFLSHTEALSLRHTLKPLEAGVAQLLESTLLEAQRSLEVEELWTASTGA